MQARSFQRHTEPVTRHKVSPMEDGHSELLNTSGLLESSGQTAK